MELNIRPEDATDEVAIHHLHREAFEAPDEAHLVDALRTGGFVEVSMVATAGDQVVGHILFTRVPVATEDGEVPSLSLAPMAVLPGFQNQGIGSALVEAGLEACREGGHGFVHVLGHPPFYPRFGFSADLAKPLRSKFGGGDAWMARELVPGALEGVVGEIRWTKPFLDLP